MRVFRIIRKSFRDAFKSVFRNFSLSMASISCTAVTLILVAVAVLVTYNVNSITEDLKDVLTIVVFVDSDATEEEISSIEESIRSISNVQDNLEYNSKDDIKNQLRDSDESMAQVIDTLTEEENPLQSTFVVNVVDVKEITDTANQIKELDKVTSVKYGESIVNQVVSMFDVVSISCIVAVIALILVTAFLIGNTIKITIFSRRQEINIMRLVGTSNIVIKLPFLIEGFVLGIIGAIVPIIITIYGYTFLYDYVGGKFFVDMMVLVEPAEIIYTCSFVLLLVGGLVGMFGSLRAVRRYLKV